MSKELEALEKLFGLAAYCNENTEGMNEKEMKKYDKKCENMKKIIEQALKRNEPMKVANITETEEGHYEVEEQGYISGRHYLITITSGECPVCGESMDDRENIVPPIFCPHCGQRLDWNK